MSLNNIELPAFALQGLYRKSLVELKSKPVPPAPAKTATLSVLGKNLKHICIVISNTEVAFLQDDELNFLLGVLAACGLNMEDVCILNIQKNKAADYNNIAKELGAQKVFLFGVSPDQLNLPLSFPHYQIQQYNGQVYLATPALTALQHDKIEKGKLWNCLRQIFSI